MVLVMSGWLRVPIRERLSRKWRPFMIAPSREPQLREPPEGQQGLYRVHLTPFADVHLNSERWRFNNKPPGSWTTVYGVGVVGFLILFVACFNFMNLATARALLRAREIALRKTHGANRGQLIVQFLGEAVLMALLSPGFGAGPGGSPAPAFGRFLQHPVAMDYASDWPLVLIIVGVTIARWIGERKLPRLGAVGLSAGNGLAR